MEDLLEIFEGVCKFEEASKRLKNEKLDNFQMKSKVKLRIYDEESEKSQLKSSTIYYDSKVKKNSLNLPTILYDKSHFIFLLVPS